MKWIYNAAAVLVSIPFFTLVGLLNLKEIPGLPGKLFILLVRGREILLPLVRSRMFKVLIIILIAVAIVLMVIDLILPRRGG